MPYEGTAHGNPLPADIYNGLRDYDARCRYAIERPLLTTIRRILRTQPGRLYVPWQLFKWEDNDD